MNPEESPNAVPAAHPLTERVREAIDAIIQCTANFIAIADHPSGRLLYINPSGRRLMGIPADDDVSGMTCESFFPERLRAALREEILQVAVAEGRWQGESLFQRQTDGECRVGLVVVALPPVGGAGTTIGISARILTENNHSSSTLEQDQLLLRALLDHLPDSIYFKDTASRFIRVGAAKAKKTGNRQPRELVGHTDFDYFTEEHARAAYNDEQRIIRTGQPVIDIEEKETWPDGRVTWVSSSKIPLHGTDGRIIGTFGVSRDITARKVTEQKLAIAQKDLLEASRLAGMAEIASGVLHNIGNALNTVNTSAALLAEQLARSRMGNLVKATQLLGQHTADIVPFLTTDDRGKQLPGYLIQLASLLSTEREGFQQELDLLRRNIEHIKMVVAMQQNYARVSSLVEDAAPSELVEEALRISEASLSRHRIGVRRNFDLVPMVRVSRHKVLLILVNLIRNSKHAMDETGRDDKEMTIGIQAAGNDRVQIVVSDNGVGIPTENLGKIFTFGFTTRKNGHGFGLHSSANAARELGGSIKAHSDGSGKGATFTLELPILPSQVPEQPPPAKA